jgi:hypothetical protein
MDALIALFLGVLGSLLAEEILANAPRLGRWLIKHAVRQLPASKRDHFNEEWLSHFDECPGAIGKLRHASGCYFRAARELADGKKLTPTQEQALVKFVTKVTARAMFLPHALPLIIRGKFNSVRMVWKVTEFMIYSVYVLKTKFGGTDADVKNIVERCKKNLLFHAEKPPIEIAMAAMKDVSEAILEIKKRRRQTPALPKGK